MGRSDWFSVRTKLIKLYNKFGMVTDCSFIKLPVGGNGTDAWLLTKSISGSLLLYNTHVGLVRDSSAVRRLFVKLAGAVGRQSALHKENSGFAAPTLPWHISTFRGYRILFYIQNPYINRFTHHFIFIHNHLALRKGCCTRLQHDLPLDPISLSFSNLQTWSRDTNWMMTATHCMMGAT